MKSLTFFKSSCTRHLLKLFPSRFSSRTLHIPSRIVGFQQGWKWSGFPVCRLRNPVNSDTPYLAGSCSAVQYAWVPNNFMKWIKTWLAEAVNCQFAFTLPHFILHVTTSTPDLENVEETVENPHQTEKPPRNDIRDVHICFTFLFTYPSRTFTDCSRFPSRTLHGPSRTANFWET